MRMSKVLIGAVVVVLILAVAGYISINRKDSFLPQKQTQVTQMPEVSGLPQQEGSDLGQGGNSYLEPRGIFSLLYPNDWKQDTQNNGEVIRFYKSGATQMGQTEMYDGVIVTVEVKDLGTQTLSEWVDKQLKTIKDNGDATIVKPKQSTTFNGYPGFTYTVRGLGEWESLAIQKDANSKNALVITALVEDPENVGYQQEVDSTLNTLKILK